MPTPKLLKESAINRGRYDWSEAKRRNHLNGEPTLQFAIRYFQTELTKSEQAIFVQPIDYWNALRA